MLLKKRRKTMDEMEKVVEEVKEEVTETVKKAKKERKPMSEKKKKVLKGVVIGLGAGLLAFGTVELIRHGKLKAASEVVTAAATTAATIV